MTLVHIQLKPRKSMKQPDNPSYHDAMMTGEHAKEYKKAMSKCLEATS